MSKRVKVFVSVLVVAVLLTVGGAATVMAQDEPAPTPETGIKGLLTRVAEILGEDISEQDLIDAFKQARQQVANETLDRILDKLLENELLTEDELAAIEGWLAQKPELADRAAMKGWLENRPEISKPGVFKHMLRASHQLRERLKNAGGLCLTLRPLIGKVAEILGIPEETLVEAFKQARQEMAWEVRDRAFGKALERAVEDERITQPEADEIETWWNERPEALGRAFPGALISRAIPGRHGVAFPRAWWGSFR